jgi:hypothetical protein
MKMVAHQNKTQHRRLKTVCRFAQQLQESSAISIIMKDIRARITSRTKMIDGIVKLYAQRPRHPS